MWYIVKRFGFIHNKIIFFKKVGIVLDHIKKIKYLYSIGIPPTCGYQHCGKKSGFIVRDMFDQSYFALPVLHNILHLFKWKFYYFTCFPKLEEYILRISRYFYDQYFSISELKESCVSCDAKVK